MFDELQFALRNSNSSLETPFAVTVIPYIQQDTANRLQKSLAASFSDIHSRAAFADVYWKLLLRSSSFKG